MGIVDRRFMKDKVILMPMMDVRISWFDGRVINVYVGAVFFGGQKM